MGKNIPELLIESIKWFADNSLILNLGFVIMPDHLHWAFALVRGEKLDNIMRRYKNCTAQKRKDLKDDDIRMWQKGCYDHLLRNV